MALAQASATAAAANAASAAGLSSVCSPRAGATPFKVRDAAAAALGLLGAATRSHWDGEAARSSSSSSSGAAASTPRTPLAGPASGLLSQQAAAATEEADALALQGYADILEALAGEVTGLRASLAEAQRAVLASEAERERLLGMTKSLEAQVGALMEQRESLTQSIESDSVHMAEALRGEGALGTLGTLRAPHSLSYLPLSPPPTPPCAETRNSKEVLSAQISLLTAERAALLEETTAWRAREQALAVNWAPKSSAVLQLPPLPALPPQLMASKTFSSRAAAPPANVVIDAVAAAVEQVQQTPQQRRLQLLQQHQQQQSQQQQPQQQPQQQQQLQQPQQPQQPISSITFNASRGGGGGGSSSSSSNSSVSNTFSIASASRQDLASWEGQRRPSISDGVATVEYVPAVRRLPPLPPNK